MSILKPAAAMLAAILCATLALTGRAQDVSDSHMDLEWGQSGNADALPVWLPPYITTTNEPQLALGTVADGQAILTLPYKYTTPLRLKTSVRTFMHKLDPGTLGFDAGMFATPWGIEPVICFFDMTKASPYGRPECVRNVGKLGVGWATAQVSSNLPMQFQPGDPIGGKPEVETDGIVIDHNFAVVMTVAGWNKKTLHLKWLSDGQTVADNALPRAEDGSVSLKTTKGSIILTEAPENKDETLVVFKAEPQ